MQLRIDHVIAIRTVDFICLQAELYRMPPKSQRRPPDRTKPLGTYHFVFLDCLRRYICVICILKEHIEFHMKLISHKASFLASASTQRFLTT